MGNHGLVWVTMGKRTHRERFDMDTSEFFPANWSAKERREWVARKAAAQVSIPRAIAALDALHDPALRVVLDLHAPNRVEWLHGGHCTGCDANGHDCDHPEWPCRTIQAIAEHHGIDLTDAFLYRWPKVEASA